MFENLQEERLDNLQEDLVSCIEGDEGHGGKKHLSLCCSDSWPNQKT